MQSLFKGLVLVFGLAIATSSPTPSCPQPSAQEAKKSEIALTDFAVNLFKNITSRDDKKNEVFSPLSIALGLALLESGADGKTREELKRTLLEVSGSQQDVLAVYRSLEEQLRIDDDKTKLIIANGLFQDKQLTLKEEFMRTIRECYKSEVQQVDFRQQLDDAREKINRFVSQKTHDKIPELFKRGQLKQTDRFVLANAIYFKASWRTAFNKASTKLDIFYHNGKEQSKENVPFMHQSINLRHSSDNDLEALELPYNNQDLAMYVVLPKQRDGMRDLERKLTGKQLRDIISRMEQKQVNVQLPKFKVRSPIDLTSILEKMGLESVFSQSADFRRMSETPLKVDSSVHEAYISVDENGTEGAAATGVAVQNRAMPAVPRVDEVTFKADHPFLYVVAHKQTGAIVFMGKINTITQ